MKFPTLTMHRPGIVASSAFLLMVATTSVHAKDHLKVIISANDYTAAESATNAGVHAKPANTAAGMNAQKTGMFSLHGASANRSEVDNSEVQVRYPGDLTYNGGAIVQSAESHAVYLNANGKCPTLECWGDPEGFLNDLAQSQFIHVTDRFVGTSANNRYTVGERVEVNYTQSATRLTDRTMQAIAHAAASKTGETGYGHIYHIFLPPGQDVCFDSTYTTCYSPDDPRTFAFCGYHGSAQFKDIGHVLYTVEPYQNVGGCSVKPGTPNGELADSTNSVLSHELFELITDPDLDAWWNTTSNALFGSENGDECSFVTFTGFDPATFKIDDKMYAVQPEYSNLHHACVTAP